MFLATRATESEPLLDSTGFISSSAQVQGPPASSGETTPSELSTKTGGQRLNRGGRTLQKADDDDAMFSL